MSRRRVLEYLVKKPKLCDTSVGTVIFLHGSGDTGPGVSLWLKQIIGREFEFDKLKILLPSAPTQPYTPNMGGTTNVWFDREKISMFVPEKLDSVDRACEELDHLVQEEVKSGRELSSIVVGGFSMGGALALHYVYRFQPDIKAVFALSSFLNQNSQVYQAISKLKNPSLLFQSHGTHDPLVDFNWGQETYQELKQRGVHGKFVPVKGMFHEMRKNQILTLIEWIENLYRGS